MWGNRINNHMFGQLASVVVLERSFITSDGVKLILIYIEDNFKIEKVNIQVYIVCKVMCTNSEIIRNSLISMLLVKNKIISKKYMDIQNKVQ